MASAQRRFGRQLEVVKRCWDLGFTSFGGPPTHFQILHRRFVAKDDPWISEEGVCTVQPCLLNMLLNDILKYKELFALTQALPGRECHLIHLV